MSDGYAFQEQVKDFGENTTCVIGFTRFELKIFRSLLPKGDDLKPLFGGLTGLTAWPGLILAGPVLGAPQAGMVLENLSLRGVTRFVSLGLCGALQPNLEWGSIVVPDGAHSDEGTSAHYPVPPESVGPDLDLMKRLMDKLDENGDSYAKGSVWTTDAPFRETREKIDHFTNMGAQCVDMETSAVMAVTRYKQLTWAGLLVVSDLLWQEKWSPGFHSREMKIGLKKAAEAILAVVQ